MSSKRHFPPKLSAIILEHSLTENFAKLNLAEDFWHITY
jgi:hypothetical protein